MADYPAHWEADVVLADGGTAHLRPIRPDDADRLREMFARLSADSVYKRFFAARPQLSDREVAHVTGVDHADRVALVVTLGGEMLAVGSYDRLGPDTAEVAFLVEDRHQGRGLGSVLLEHLAAAGRERGLARFVAEVLPANRQMLNVFLEAGYEAHRSFEDGVVHLEFPIAETEQSVLVMRSREQRAEARSIERLLTPRSVAVIGVSREEHGVGRQLLRTILAAGFQGPVYPVHPEVAYVASIRAYPSILDVPGEVDLAVLATPAATVPGVLADCAAKGVRGVVVVSSGFAEQGPDGEALQRRVVTIAREHGMRVIGPNCLGILNTDPAVSLNATLAPAFPGRGRVGFFCQSGALGIAILESVAHRGLGLSTFVSAGNRADVSGNDLMQFWDDDPATDVVLLYLESFGNPRKFGRIARRLGRSKPVVAVRSGRSLAGLPAGHAGSAVRIPEPAVDALFAQAGVVRVDTLAQLFDVALLLAHQPLPAGRRVAIVGNSAALGVLAADACETHGLAVTRDVDVGAGGSAADYRAALVEALDAPDVDALVTVFIPPLATAHAEVAAVLAEVTAGRGKPVVSTFLAFEGVPAALTRPGAGGTPDRGSIPSYRSPDTAVLALARAAAYAEWRARPAGRPVDPAGIDPDRAATVVAEALEREPAGGPLPVAAVLALLDAYGVPVWPTARVGDVEEAVRVADAVGYPVAVKAASAGLRHRTDLGGVRLDLAGPEQVRAAVRGLRALGESALDVQPMAPAGVAVVVEVVEDPSFGALVSLGLAGVATELLGDRAYRAVPLTDVDAHELVRAPKAAPLLFGHRGAAPADVAALEELLARIGRLADDRPEVCRLELNPVLVATAGVSVLHADVWVAPSDRRFDTGPRRLR